MTDAESLDAIEETALLQAFWRARETRRSQPRFCDPLACAMTEAFVDAARAERFSSDIPVYAEIHVSSVVAVDRALARWGAAIAGPSQIVVLGCGFDGRAARCAPGDASFFLVDRRRVLDLLAPQIEALPFVTLVESNLARADTVFDALAVAGWEASTPTAFVAEGVAEFLGVPAMRRLASAIVRRAGAGSILLLQMLDASLVAYAARIGDATFPWKRLPDPSEVVGGDFDDVVQALPYDGPTWVRDAIVTPLSHIFAIACGVDQR